MLYKAELYRSETIFIDNISEQKDCRLLTVSFLNEKVVSAELAQTSDSLWVLHSDNIWKTTIDFDIWQLFVDRCK